MVPLIFFLRSGRIPAFVRRSLCNVVLKCSVFHPLAINIRLFRTKPVQRELVLKCRDDIKFGRVMVEVRGYRRRR